MAPRQLIMPPMEDDLNPEPGSKRVSPSIAPKRARRRCDCAPARAPVALPRLALRTGLHCWHCPGPMARACQFIFGHTSVCSGY
eukprot:scaffold7404_cov135-Isochrysis_galbana.AAC.4